MKYAARREVAVIAGAASAALYVCNQKKLSHAIASIAALLYLLPGKVYRYAGKTAVISGGSRGLGFSLARNLIEDGSNVVLLARHKDELDHAKEQLGQLGTGRILVIECDVTQEADLQEAIAIATGTFGKIDLWFNIAGAILVGSLRSMTLTDFEQLLDTQVAAIWLATQNLLPFFKKAGGGKIINISSIGGKVAVPHLGAYSTAKFAMAGLSSTMHSELAAENIQVTTVFPGLMRVGSAPRAVLTGDSKREYLWFSSGTVTPVVSVSADAAARKILKGVAHGNAEIVFPSAMRAATWIQAAFPELTAWATELAAAQLPPNNSQVHQSGSEAEVVWDEIPGGNLVKSEVARHQRENNEL